MSAADMFAYRPARWPLLAAGMAALLGFVMLVAAALAYRQADHITAQAPGNLPAAAAAPESLATTPAIAIEAPPVIMYVSDLRALIKLTGERRLSLGSIDYQSELNRPAGALLKHVTLHVDDEYPKLKAFIAELLRIMPHAQLEELQIEQSSASPPTPKIRANIKLVFLYTASGAKAEASRGAAGS